MLREYEHGLHLFSLSSFCPTKKNQQKKNLEVDFYEDLRKKATDVPKLSTLHYHQEHEDYHSKHELITYVNAFVFVT